MNYEAIITELATLLLAPPAPWTGRAAYASISPLRPVDRRPGLQAAWSAAPLLASAARRAQARRTCAARRPQPVGRRAPAVQAGQGHHRRWSGGQRLVHPGPQDGAATAGTRFLCSQFAHVISASDIAQAASDTGFW